jgi:hypothetical protein
MSNGSIGYTLSSRRGSVRILLARGGTRVNGPEVVWPLVFALLAWSALTANALDVVVGGRLEVALVQSPDADALERRAAGVVAAHLLRITGQSVSRPSPQGLDPLPGTIALGTPASHPWIGRLAAQGRMRLAALGAEGYHLLLVPAGRGEAVAIGANDARGVLYGAYAFVEALIARQLGRRWVDADFLVPRAEHLAMDALNERSAPFYPVRMTLDSDNPEWLAAHRVNASGAEGIWSGTGSDDGLGAAFQYVEGYDAFQDRTLAWRRRQIELLLARTAELRRWGVASFLFMYVVGEPTKALTEARPDLLGPTVEYAAARNGRDYRPLCWSNPDVKVLFAELARNIVRTYPDLSGFHLRAWGMETRPCHCPECSGRDEQEVLWDIVHAVVAAAREERPGFRLILSGYEANWLQDPTREHLRRLPPDTVILGKWGSDGEPTADPRIPRALAADIADAGLRYVVLSHEAEEVQPLWMLEAELFARGVRLYANDATVRGVGGFTLQGQVGLGTLDRRVSARLNWDPGWDVEGFLTVALETRYGADAARPLLAALLSNAWTLSDFFRDYAGLFKVAGAYRRGSESFATRLWDVFGAGPVGDTLALPDKDAVAYVQRRLNQLQSEPVSAARNAADAWAAAGVRGDSDLADTVRLMDMWRDYFASRRWLVEAVALGMAGVDRTPVAEALAQAVDLSRRARSAAAAITSYQPLLGATKESLRDFLLRRMQQEIQHLEGVRPEDLIRPAPEPEQAGESEGTLFRLLDVLNAPSPVVEGTSFVYTLTLSADWVAVDIYSAVGRRVRRLADAPTTAGYNEVYWDGRDAEGRRVGNGVYFYRMTARRDDAARQATGRFAVLR